MANEKRFILVGLIAAVETVTDRAVLLLPESLRRVLRRIYPVMVMVRIYINIRAYMHNIYRYWKDSKSLKVKEHKDYLAVEIGKYNNIEIGTHSFKIAKYDIAITSEFGGEVVPMSHLVRCNKGSYKQITQSLYIRNAEIWGYLKHYKLQEGDVVIDAGAYWGDTTVPLAKMVGENGKVIALEPIPQICNLLGKNILINGLDNVVILEEALFNTTGLQKFKLTDDWYIADEGDESERIYPLKTTTIDELVKRLNLSKVDFIKMDIEGSEIEAIEGAKETINRFHPAFAIASYHASHLEDGKQTWEAIEPTLKEYGYEVFTEYPVHLTTYATWRR